jgi:uncharacterized protein (DUF2235 family)
MPTPRNLVVCLDGTSNEPEHGVTNVARLYDVAVKDEHQLVYYDPGVGTMGARGAITQIGQALTRVAGLVMGYGIKDNIEEAYTWLSRNYQPGDRIYVFGFSRGAYTARALTGMLSTVGLLRPGTENLAPYALKLYAQGGPPKAKPGHEDDPAAKLAKSEYWKVRRDFAKQFGNPDFPDHFDTSRRQVHFLGVWDSVKSVGWLNLKGQIEMARWPFTAYIENVATARHAMAIDERRRPFAEYRFREDMVAASGGAHQEMWFAGVHSDVGGQFPDDHDLSDIAFAWMVKEAAGVDLAVDGRRYHALQHVHLNEELPAEHALGTIHENEWPWWLAGGWRHRTIRPTDTLHPSVLHRIDATANDPKPYRPDLRRATSSVQ